ncbi:uncharacterized protein [Rutidosis leptorrhynchoides]|uniref:uncharacterized protein n=1 Tax=Rutidosis leptorrhynchoides TaxID=125765 RepID=UPI003A9A1279
MIERSLTIGMCKVMPKAGPTVPSTATSMEAAKVASSPKVEVATDLFEETVFIRFALKNTISVRPMNKKFRICQITSMNVGFTVTITVSLADGCESVGFTVTITGVLNKMKLNYEFRRLKMYFLRLQSLCLKLCIRLSMWQIGLLI